MKKKYSNLDGLRAFSCLGIIAMHIQANTDFDINGMIYNTIIPSWTTFVYLFLMISGFGMFCGYYEQFKNQEMNINDFYIKRYCRILPFFALLIVLDILISYSKESLFEGFIEVTLVYGLLPNNQLEVIGVGWTLGVIFLFYMLFPFFVFLLDNRKRAWFVLCVSVMINILCHSYFFSGKFVVEEFAHRHSFLFCAPFFIMGGMIYLYKEEIETLVRNCRWQVLLIAVTLTFFYFIIPDKISNFSINVYELLMIFSVWLAYAIGPDDFILNNSITKYLSGISLEMYLAQMVIFRGIEKMGLIRISGIDWLDFCFVFLLTILGLIIFIQCYHYGVRLIRGIIENRDKNRK